MGIKNLGFWNIEEYEDDDGDFVWLNTSFEFSNTFLAEMLHDTTNINSSDNVFGELDDTELEMEERIFDQQFKYILYSSKPNKSVRKYKKVKNSKSKNASYDYSTNTDETDDKSIMKELGNSIFGYPSRYNYNILPKRDDPLVDIITSKNQVKLVMEMPLVNKKDIQIKAYDDHVEIHATNVQEGKYHHVIDIPSDLDISSGKSTYRNGILEIVFCKRRSFKIKVK